MKLADWVLLGTGGWQEVDYEPAMSERGLEHLMSGYSIVLTLG
jgi:hypothetical protein